MGKASRKASRGVSGEVSENGGATEPATYTIGDLAREFQVSLRTLRFYEDRGLLAPRREGALRLYGARDRLRLSQVLRGKELGFTLAEISAMLAESSSAAGPRGDARAPLALNMSLDRLEDQITYLENQRSEIDRALADLTAQREALKASG